MDKGSLFIALAVVLLFVFLMGLVVHAAIRDKQEEAERLRKKIALSNYVDEVERAMRNNKKLTDPEAVKRFHQVLDAQRSNNDK